MGADTGGRKERVLIVDDEQEMLDSLGRHFEVEGIDVVLCDSALKALELLREETFNIVLTDIRMPEMDGVELLRAIKGMNPLCNVIIMTAYSNMSYLMDCFSAGACDYFSKPFHDVDLIVQAVRQAIDRVIRWRKGMGFQDFPGTP